MKSVFSVLAIGSLAGLGVLVVSGWLAAPARTVIAGAEKPRVVILTDISSLEPGVAEPDDGQSLVRLMLYTNDLEIEGLIASSNLGHGQKTRPELIRKVVETYGQVHPTLVQHDPAYPSADRLLSLIKSGQPQAGPKVPVTTSIGADRDTEASDWIIRVVDQPDPRPVWVCVWGGTADLAQALWKVRQTRSSAELQTFISRLRIHAIADQDATGPWIREQFPTLFYILNRHNFRGVYRGGDTRLADSSWVVTSVHKKDNPLGMLYPNYTGGDIWASRIGRVMGIKEGDSPSFLSLVPNGLNVPERPDLGGWGGLFSRNKAGFYQDQVDSTVINPRDPTPYMASVYRWRPDWQADFVTRLQWCTKPFKQANHAPQVVIDGQLSHEPVTRLVKPGAEIRLDAGKSADPDRQSLQFHWQIYPKTGPQDATLSNEQTARVRIRIATTARPQTIPLLLTVTDAGQPALRSYRRVFLQVP
ncbi:DUF1593 domain-containing protein [Larkinella bovis]|uniref:DUF1593 domain-containing protein n=1 Tax=Larkinella bovis TaxID=683041 RepID=A0ABW0IAA3_9BACT